METKEEFLKRCQKDYKSGLDLPSSEYQKYPNGKSVETVVPSETAINKFMIVGAYPTAKYVNKEIPYDNIERPFSTDTAAGLKLDEMLSKIGINRNDCWITNLVKIYLPQGSDTTGEFCEYNRTEKWEIFSEYARKSIKWLYEELSIANPKIIITLGDDVFNILKEVDTSDRKLYRMENGMIVHPLGDDLSKITLNGRAYKIIRLKHPGFFLRGKSECEKRERWELFVNNEAPETKKIISTLINS